MTTGIRARMSDLRFVLRPQDLQASEEEGLQRGRIATVDQLQRHLLEGRHCRCHLACKAVMHHGSHAGFYLRKVRPCAGLSFSRA